MFYKNVVSFLFYKFPGVTEQTGLAAIKITSLIRPALLLKFSSLVDTVEMNRSQYGDMFNLNIVCELSDEQFSSDFNGVDAGVQFTASELGELRNMFSRVVELGKVRLFLFGL